MIKSQLGFKSSLIVTVVISLVLSLSIVGFLSYQLVKEQVEGRLIENIRGTLNAESNEILDLFKRAEEAVSSFATVLEKNNDVAKYPELLALSAPMGGVSKLTLGFNDGSSYTSKPSSKTFPGGVGIKSKYDPRTRPWYQEGIKVSGLSLSSPFFTKQGDPMVGVMHSLNGGLVLADLRFGNLKSKLEELNEKENTPSFIIEKSGLILASTIEGLVEKENLFDSEFKDIAADLLAAQTGAFEYDLQGVTKLFLTKKIELINGGEWYFVLSTDKEAAYAPVREATEQLVTILLITSSISILILLLVMKRIYKPILSLRTLISGLSQGDGDLTQRLAVHSKDDIGHIAIGINAFIEHLQNMMKEVRVATEQLSERVEDIHLHSEENSVVLSQHASETEQIVAAVEELSSSAMMVSDNSTEAANSANDAKSSSNNANEKIQQSQVQIAQLANEILQAANNVKHMDEATGNIQSIVEVIGGIAEQTNLLALNASIEAARAGEQGRGFAVVADEVRALASRTQVSTTEIGDAITSLQKEASGVVSAITNTQTTCQVTVDSAEAVSDILQALNEHITGINQMNSEISNSAEEQSRVIQTVSQNITELHGMVEKLSAIGSNQFEEVRKISEVNKNLSSLIGKFKL